MAMGLAEARSRDPNLSEKERAAQFDKTIGMSEVDPGFRTTG